MHKSYVLRTVFLSTVFALLTIVLMTPVASAHTTIFASRTATVTSQVPDIPSVDIVFVGTSEFSQSTLSCQVQIEPCFKITNRAPKDEEVINGATDIILRPGQSALITLYVGPGIYRFLLAANAAALLTVTAS